jgi:hypothetical protein
MEINSIDDLLVEIYIFLGGEKKFYNHNEDLFSNISRIIEFVEADKRYVSVDSEYVQIEKKLLDKNNIDLHMGISDALDSFIINNGIKIQDKIFKF